MHACRLNFRLRDSCKDDLATVCPKVCKDATKRACGGRALRCLTDNSAKIRSKGCRDEVFYFEKMEVRWREQPILCLGLTNAACRCSE